MSDEEENNPEEKRENRFYTTSVEDMKKARDIANAVLSAHEENQDEEIDKKEMEKTIAYNKFVSECNRLNLDPMSTTPEMLKGAQALKNLEGQKAPEGGESAPLNEAQLTGKSVFEQQKELREERMRLAEFNDVPIGMIAADSPQELLKILSSISSNSEDKRAPIAKKALGKLAKKSLSQNQEWEYQGSVLAEGRPAKGRKKGEWKRVDKQEGE